MNKDILKNGVQDFIQKNWNADTLSVLLKKQQFKGVTQKELATQLEAKKKCQHKLPPWFSKEGIYYPLKLHIEQTSSAKTAAYKAGLVGGKSLLDITGGFGVDSHFFAQRSARVIHCEINQELLEIAAYNSQLFGIENIEFQATNGIVFLKGSQTKFDWIYADPSRRNTVKGKVFRLADCSPDIPQNLDLIFEHTNAFLLKTSPLLDITLAIKELKWTTEIHIVAVQNEVKETLFVLQKKADKNIKIKTVNLKKEGDERFDFLWATEKTTETEYGLPQKYLYEPNAAILKSGGFKSVGKAYGLQKLQEHSHLYTSNSMLDFPGRRFAIEKVLPYSKKEMKVLSGKKANITVRNFPDSVAKLRKKHKIPDGGDTYLFFTINLNKERVVIVCKKA